MAAFIIDLASLSFAVFICLLNLSLSLLLLSLSRLVPLLLVIMHVSAAPQQHVG